MEQAEKIAIPQFMSTHPSVCSDLMLLDSPVADED